MDITRIELEERLARFEKACRSAGAKLTHQRLEIYREVARRGDHPNAEDVYQGVRERMPTVSLDTVYRTLWWLEELGLIKVIGPQRERARFDANLEGHHHFVCSQCGLMHDFICKEFNDLKPPDSLRSIGRAERIQVEAIGLCQKCVKETGGKAKN